MNTRMIGRLNRFGCGCCRTDENRHREKRANKRRERQAVRKFIANNS